MVDNTTRSPNLDLLRSVAVACVFVFHLRRSFGSERLWGADLSALGLAGVLLFFVHTSLVLMLSIERTAAVPGPVARPFYIRRLFRIYPLSVVCVLAAIVLNQPSAPWLPYAPVTFMQAAANLLLVQNVTAHASILGPLWSLPYEVQMCLLLPLAYALVVRRFGLMTVASVVAASVLVPVAEMRVTGNAHLFHYAPCFTGGILAFWLLRSKHPQVAAWLWPAAIAMSVALFCTVDRGRMGDRRLTAVLEWSFCILFGLLVPCFSEIRSLAVHRVSQTIAKYSYGIYLTHSFAMWIAFVRLGACPLAVRWAAFVLLAVAAPVAAYHALEEPLIRIGHKVAGRLSRSYPQTSPSLSVSRAAVRARGESLRVQT